MDPYLSQGAQTELKRVQSKSEANQRPRKTLEDYEFAVDEHSKLKTSDLGAGAFGKVKRVREKQTGEIFAMKIINKQTVFRYSTKENLKREINIQKSMCHPHITRLYNYFEDGENVYIILEYAENGTLFEYIRKKRGFSETEAFIYFFQTVLGLDYLHKRNIIHRDLKPENLLLDKDGNIKLCDFGWSAEANSKRLTYCGTVDYMAPEIVKNLPYDHRIDIWALGVLLYELLHGRAPFGGKTEGEKTSNIAKNTPIKFDRAISPEACDLITRILKPAPLDRLSMDEIFRHPWMKKFEKVYNIDIMSYVVQQDFDLGENSAVIGSTAVGSSSRRDSREAKSKVCLNETFGKDSSGRSSKGKIITILDDKTPLNLNGVNFAFPEKSGYSKESKKGSIGDSSTHSNTNSRSGSEVNSLHNLLKDYQASSMPGSYTGVENLYGKKEGHHDHSNYIKAQYSFDTHAEKNFVEPVSMNIKKVQTAKESSFYNDRGRSKYDLDSAVSDDARRHRSEGRHLTANMNDKAAYAKYQGPVYQRSLKDNQIFSSIYERNAQIEKKLRHTKHISQEPNFFQKLLMGIGCITRDTNKDPDF